MGVQQRAWKMRCYNADNIPAWRLHCIVFHEPWFDEAQSWAIARSGTIKEILFEIPHYEGHPPLWHLILVPFAKLGAPYELSLAAVNIFL